MSSKQDVRLGCLVPQIVHRPPGVVSLDAATECIELADAYGVADGHPLDASQRFTIETALGTRADGTWAAATVADFEPRQNGKNDSIAARELAGLILFGEQLIIHTAHEFPTANESFLRLVAVFENYDDLRRRVARIRYANGEQGIELLSGQRLKYRARTGGSGRGFAKADLVVYDEAQHLKAEHVAASGPARIVNKNPQSWYSGSGGFAHSANAWRLRKRALSGNGGRLAYVEHTAEVVELDSAGRVVSESPADMLDRDAWARANPAYGWRVTDEAFLSLYEELGPELFGRECLNLWEPEPGTGSGVISTEAWARCCDPQSSVPGRVVFALTCSPDRTVWAVGVTGWRADGRPHVAVFEGFDRSRWIVDVLAELVAEHQPLGVVIDPASAAGSVITECGEKGIAVVEAKGRDNAQAFGVLLDEVSRGLLAHRGQVSLASALAVARKRRSADGESWDRTASNIAALDAVTLARWGLDNCTPAQFTGSFLDLADYLPEE